MCVFLCFSNIPERRLKNGVYTLNSVLIFASVVLTNFLYFYILDCYFYFLPYFLPLGPVSNMNDPLYFLYFPCNTMDSQVLQGFLGSGKIVCLNEVFFFKHFCYFVPASSVIHWLLDFWQTTHFVLLTHTPYLMFIFTNINDEVILSLL